MAMKDYVFTSESVAEGHPDKVADRISDSILDAILTEDKSARVACETLVTTGLALVAGESPPPPGWISLTLFAPPLGTSVTMTLPWGSMGNLCGADQH